MNRVRLRSSTILVDTGRSGLGEYVDGSDHNESLHYDYTEDPEDNVLRTYAIVAMFESLQNDAVRLDRIKSLQFLRILNDDAITTLRNRFCCDTRNAIISFQKLQSLRIIENTRITSQSTENLAFFIRHQLSSLIDLDLSKNPRLFTDPRCLALLLETLHGEQCHVKFLNLSHNSIGRRRKAVEHISKLLRNNNNQSIQHMNLSHNFLGPRHMCSDGGLYNNQTLLSLDLSNNVILNAGVRTVMKAIDTERGSKSVLEELYLSHNLICGIGDTSIFEVLSHNKNKSLKKLDLSNNEIGIIGGDHLRLTLQFNYNLKEVDLSGNMFCEEGNNVDGLQLITDGLSDNTDYSTLIRLDLGMTRMRDKGAIAISQMLRKNRTIQILNLSNNYIETDGMNAILDALPHNTSIRELWLHNNNVTDESFLISYICNINLCQLDVLTYKGNPFKAGQLENIISAFRFHNNMKTWLCTFLDNIQQYNIRDVRLLTPEVIYGDLELKEIVNQFVHHPVELSLVYLDGGNITDVGISHFADNVLGGEEKLRLTHLYCYSLARLHTIGIESIARCLQMPACSLLGLTLCDCNIGPDGATAIARYLPSNQSLKLLCLQSNQISDIGARTIFSAILEPPHPTLKTLNISNNHLTDNALEGMGHWTQLEEVLLNRNQISDLGVLDIRRAVMDSSSIQYLNLRNNPDITPGGIELLQAFDHFVLDC